MTSAQGLPEPALIVQIARDGEVDRFFRANPSPSVTSGQVAVEHLPAGPGGRLDPPEAGEVVLSVLSPEGLRQPDEVRQAISTAPAEHTPLVILVGAAEELREDELGVVLDAVTEAPQPVILRVLADG
jgi:hypothetical protein